jgi:hypothetical protein
LATQSLKVFRLLGVTVKRVHPTHNNNNHRRETKACLQIHPINTPQSDSWFSWQGQLYLRQARTDEIEFLLLPGNAGEVLFIEESHEYRWFEDLGQVVTATLLSDEAVQ